MTDTLGLGQHDPQNTVWATIVAVIAVPVALIPVAIMVAIYKWFLLFWVRRVGVES